MSITVNKINEIRNNKTVSDVRTMDEAAAFNYQLEPPTDSLVKKELWSENNKCVLFNAVQEMGINSYNPSILKDDNKAIAAAQHHLVDLMKYYEGDRNYYYEAFTIPYTDKFGTATCGFGELTNKAMSQEKAYENLCKKLSTYSKEVKNLLNKRIGTRTYEALPNSVKEGLIDLCYNKGLGKISSNKDLMEAVKSKNYSKVIANLKYVYSGKSNAEKVEDAGLYRRSLNRAILASRDLKGNELLQAKAEIEKLYNSAKQCHEKYNVPTNELDKIYEQYSKGKISSEPVSAESYKFIVDDSFKGKGTWAVTQALYKSLGNSDISFKDFYNKFMSINNNPDKINVGQALKIPYMKKSASAPEAVKVSEVPEISVKEKQNVEINNIEQKENKTEKTEKKGFWSKVWGGVKNFFNKVGNFFKNLFGCNEKNEAATPNAETFTTPFQRMLKYGQIHQDGEFQIINLDYEVKKGDNLWRLSRNYGTSEEILCNDNNIENKNDIKVGQIIKIQKLGYKIEKGDNLFRIAKKFGLTVEILKDLNNIVDVDKINAGQFIEIPGFVYTVKPKDTLTKISKQVGVCVKDLMKINGLESDVISPNQKIKVVYNDSDYSVSADKKKVIVDTKNNTKKETVDMSGTANLANRPLLKQKNKINGKVTVTKHTFEPTRQGSLSGKTIIVNAGHGYSQAGTDPGVLGSHGLEDEWLINYDNAMRLKDRLCAKGARVIFMQGHVNLITKELAKQSDNADMFISVHVNSFEGKTQDRTQIYSAKNKRAVNNKSKKLAGLMEKNFDNWIPKNEEIAEKDKFVDRCKQDYAQSMEANYAVICSAEKYKNIPSVLWEVAFMASPKGRERMSNPALMNNYSDIMTKSIEEYFRA